MALQNYSPEDVTVLLAGVKPIQGFIDGTFIEIDKNTQTFQPYRSADGKIARKKDNDFSYTVRFTLMSTSASNDVLDYLAKVDQLTSMGKVPLIIKDQLGSTSFYSATTWIETIPTVTFSTGISERTWVLRSSQGILVNGGNEDASSLLEDTANIVLASLPMLEGLL